MSLLVDCSSTMHDPSHLVASESGHFGERLDDSRLSNWEDNALNICGHVTQSQTSGLSVPCPVVQSRPPFLRNSEIAICQMQSRCCALGLCLDSAAQTTMKNACCRRGSSASRSSVRAAGHFTNGPLADWLAQLFFT